MTKVILLGSGNPNPDPIHSDPSIIILVHDTPYVIDFGTGLIRRAANLSTEFGGTIEAMNVKNLKIAFLTHLHSDHTLGYADLILTPWIMERDVPLEVYGPEGITEMTEYLLKAYKEDIRYRIYGSEPINTSGWKVITHEIKEGQIYKDSNITVDAFLVQHGTLPNAFGFKFTTPNKTIVISGDTAPCENILKYGKNADILIHEVYYKKGYDEKEEKWKKYHIAHHTSTLELAEIANKTKPKLLILYHTLFWGGTNKKIIQEITDHYKGKVVLASDLDIY
ncbi:MAG: hydrolase [Candidatus Fischerbacteria bacterium RBG_13_37_8]|uniref:Hydrolase n=1 Tax=Candidatus Fischerbacteria bacterium RBG_13_37_8 TaxID=1817863 RepID=A0A1F5VU50_9BACT|nr:MAG: hydrolase [Candidatus Fischerbacteria bacterium RBG_13_37_8]